MELLINKITITGFKGYKDTVEYELGNRTLITGNNGQGKSSVGEAIAWCFTGCDIWGNEKAATRLVNDKGPKVTEVILEFTLDGEPQTIIRRKKSTSNEVYWNGKKSNTNDISREIFYSKDIFLSIINPYYFSSLTPKDEKAILSDILKPVKQEEIFNELGDYLKEILLNNDFRIPETFLADSRINIKEHEENIIYLEGVLDGLTEDEVEEKKVFDETVLNNTKDELKNLKDTCNVDEAIAKLIKPSDITNELKSLEMSERIAKSELNNLVLQELISIEQLESKRKTLLNEYHIKNNKLNNMEHKTVRCENCGNKIDLSSEVVALLKEDIKQILKEGTDLKNKIEEAQEKNNKIIKNNNEIKAVKEKEVSEKLQEIKDKKAELIFKYNEELRVYEEKVKAIKTASESEETKDKIQFLTNKVNKLEEERQLIITHNAQVDVAIKHNSNLIKEKELNLEKIQNSKNKIAQLKLAIDAAKQYNSIKIKKQAAQIKPFLKDVEIQFEEMNKDGELKDKFKICYQQKEFNKLSNAEKIKAGLEIANLLINIKDLHFPIFLDNAESITRIPELETQMIIAKVTDKEINVEVQE